MDHDRQTCDCPEHQAPPIKGCISGGITPGGLVRSLAGAVKECCLAFPQDEEGWLPEEVARGLHIQPDPQYCRLELIEQCGKRPDRVTLFINRCETGFAGHWTTEDAICHASARLRELGVDDVAIEDFDSYTINGEGL